MNDLQNLPLAVSYGFMTTKKQAFHLLFHLILIMKL